YGHAEGDRVLCDFAALLQRELRGGDTLARVGGEEFAIVLFGVGLHEAGVFAARIGRELESQSNERSGDGPALSASAGVSALSEHERDPEALSLAADRALYAAKTAGRRRVAVWERGAARVEAHIPDRPARDEPELAA
ncbi:MAG TPA: GGDEF domain-containing protein, partial [Polyangiaceae bacterium]|nr:GGDEF domain-containing protein [Polyangiaceae bacterium]